MVFWDYRQTLFMNGGRRIIYGMSERKGGMNGPHASQPQFEQARGRVARKILIFMAHIHHQVRQDFFQSIILWLGIGVIELTHKL